MNKLQAGQTALTLMMSKIPEKKEDRAKMNILGMPLKKLAAVSLKENNIKDIMYTKADGYNKAFEIYKYISLNEFEKLPIKLPFFISIALYLKSFFKGVIFAQIITLLILFEGAPAHAGDHTIRENGTDLSWVHDLNALAEKIAKEPNPEAIKIVKQAKSAASNPKVCSAAKMVVKDAHDSLGFQDQKRDEDRYPDLLVFVSFSMSDALLKTLANQAKEKGGKIVFRGLLNGSFKEMGQKLRALGVEALIDPTLFQKHNVVQVPTFLHKEDKLAGNVSVTFALKTFEEGRL